MSDSTRTRNTDTDRYLRHVKPEIISLMKCRRCHDKEPDCDMFAQKPGKSCTTCISHSRPTGECEPSRHLRMLRDSFISGFGQIFPTTDNAFQQHIEGLIETSSGVNTTLAKAMTIYGYGRNGTSLLDFRPKKFISDVEKELQDWTSPRNNHPELYMLCLPIYAPCLVALSIQRAVLDKSSDTNNFIRNAHRSIMQITNHWRRAHAAYLRLSSRSSKDGLRQLIFGTVTASRTFAAPTEQVLNKLSPVRAMHQLISEVPSEQLGPSATLVKSDLKRAVTSIWRLTYLIGCQKITHGENNLRMLFTWVFLCDLSEAFYERFPLKASVDDLHPIWQAVLCHWAYACHWAWLAAKKADEALDFWYLRDIATSLCEEFLQTQRNAPTGNLWDVKFWRPAMEHVFRGVGGENMHSWKDGKIV